MSSSRFRFLAAAIACAAALAGFLFWSARRAAPPASVRLAILPFDDQTSLAACSWPARLLPFSLVRQWEGAPRLQISAVRSSAEAAGATHELAGFLSSRRETLTLHLFLYELPSHKLIYRTVLQQPASRWSSLFISAAQALAAPLHLPGQPRPPFIHSKEAARSFAEALAAADLSTAEARYRSAVAADSACGWCWLALAESAARRSGRDAALAAISAARAYRDSLDPFSRARLDLLDANLRSALPAAASALQALAALLPADLRVHSQLAETLVALRRFREAAPVFRRALDLQPSSPALWNTYAYALAYDGRFDRALDAIQHYAQLDSSANPDDSRGEILLMAGRFRQAAQALESSYEKDKNFNDGAALEKAALAWMLDGDAQRASTSINRYLSARAQAGDPWLEITRARWEFITGLTASARARLRRLAAQPASPFAPIAASMLALREAAAGGGPSVSSLVLTAAKLARNPAHTVFAAFAAAAADPSAASSIQDPALRAEARALALTLRRDWPQAIEAWRASLAYTRGGAESPHRELLALCLISAGRAQDAAAVLGASWPLLTREQMLFYDFLIYPNVFYVRAEIARASNRAPDSQRLYDLFLQYAGDRPDPAGHIARARSAARL